MDEQTHGLVLLIVTMTGFYVGLIVMWIYWRRIVRIFGIPVHIFQYRNPYSRTCIHCGLCQDQYQWSWNKSSDPGWWETMYPLPHTPGACGLAKFKGQTNDG